MISAATGVASFWLWLGYSYFDPLHALLTLILLPFLILAFVMPMPRMQRKSTLDLRNDRVWRRALRGQLCFVISGIGFMIGGLVIASVGVSSVFVHTDLMYLRTTQETLAHLSHHLVPVIAHDRAGFGGALFADGVAMTIATLRGFERGAKWLWWTLLASGIPGFGATISIHFAIGYTTFIHLPPVYFAAALYILGLSFSFEYLNDRPIQTIGREHGERRAV